MLHKSGAWRNLKQRREPFVAKRLDHIPNRAPAEKNDKPDKHQPKIILNRMLEIKAKNGFGKVTLHGKIQNGVPLRQIVKWRLLRDRETLNILLVSNINQRFNF